MEQARPVREEVGPSLLPECLFALSCRPAPSDCWACAQLACWRPCCMPTVIPLEETMSWRQRALASLGWAGRFAASGKTPTLLLMATFCLLETEHASCR